MGRALRIGCVLFGLSVVGGAVYRLVLHERQRAVAVDAARRFDLRIQEAVRDLHELRATQAAYVAAGQGAAYWTRRGATLLQEIAADLQALDQLAAEPLVRAAIADARAGLAELDRLDLRARQYVEQDQRLMASDVVFTEGLETLGNTIRAVDQARDARRQAAVAEEAAIKGAERLTLAGAAGLLLLLLVAMVPAPRPAETAGELRSWLESERDEPAQAAPARSADAGTQADSFAMALQRSESREQALPAAKPDGTDWPAAATLCQELAELASPGELGVLLGRALELLHARGLVVWAATPEGPLRPVAAHGYSTDEIARLPAVQAEADNATAAAFRSRALQEVPGQGTATGALIAPIVNAGGCHGVVAVELSAGREADSHTQALVRVIAAQLASLVDATASTGQRAREVPRSGTAL